MSESIVRRNWWLPFLVIFDFIYYYFIKHISTPKVNSPWVKVNWEGFIFVFLISLLSLGCVHWIKRRLDRLALQSITFKYFQILIYSFVLFIVLTAGMQFALEYSAGKQRNLEYVISNGLTFLFLHILISNAYVALAYFRESASLRQDLILTQKAKAESELKVLQQQMSPHFLFNNLNTLTSLIPEDKEKAVRFTNELSKVFQYLSQNANRDLLTLREELDFLSSYMELMNVRFGEAYKVHQDLGGIDPRKILIVPLSLQLVLENVVKHNIASRKEPLEIELYTDEKYLMIKNKIRKKKVAKNSRSGLGLKNLKDRYRLTTGQSIRYEEINSHFLVQLPLVKRIDDESIDH